MSKIIGRLRLEPGVAFSHDDLIERLTVDGKRLTDLIAVAIADRVPGHVTPDAIDLGDVEIVILSAL